MKALRTACLIGAAALAGGIAAPRTARAADTGSMAAAATTTVITSPAAPGLLLEPPARRCREGCPGHSPSRLAHLTDEVLRQLGDVPLLDAVMAPVIRGVTLETGDGKPGITLAVKPTKITRGTGLVAIGRF